MALVKRRPRRANVAPVGAAIDRRVVVSSVASHDDDLQLVIDEIHDYVERMRKATLTLQIAMRREDLRKAARIGSQIAALARLAESRLIVVAERRHAVLTLAERLLNRS